MSISRQIKSISRFLIEEDGTTAVEYAVMIALILGVIIGSVALLGPALNTSFEESGDAMTGAFGS